MFKLSEEIIITTWLTDISSFFEMRNLWREQDESSCFWTKKVNLPKSLIAVKSAPARKEIFYSFYRPEDISHSLLAAYQEQQIKFLKAV